MVHEAFVEINGIIGAFITILHVPSMDIVHLFELSITDIFDMDLYPIKQLQCIKR